MGSSGKVDLSDSDPDLLSGGSSSSDDDDDDDGDDGDDDDDVDDLIADDDSVDEDELVYHQAMHKIDENVSNQCLFGVHKFALNLCPWFKTY